jgi:hypothetical protein
MAQKNACLFRRRMTMRKFHDLLRLFAVAITADRAAILTGLHHKTTVALFQLLRWRMAALAREGCPLQDVVEAGVTRHHRIDKYDKRLGCFRQERRSHHRDRKLLTQCQTPPPDVQRAAQKPAFQPS